MKTRLPVVQKNPTTKRQVASLTKIMTLYTSLQLVKKFKIDPEKTIVPVSRKAAYMIGTSATLKQGDKILMKDIFYGLMLPSGNDAAYALAEFFGLKLLEGSLRKFDDDMIHNLSDLTELIIFLKLRGGYVNFVNSGVLSSPNLAPTPL